MSEGLTSGQQWLFADLGDPAPSNPAGRGACVDALTEQQSAFIDHYLQTMNATAAARAAGYSERTARQQGSRLLSNVVVQAEMRRRLVDIRQSRRISIEGVLDQLGRLAYADARKLYAKGGGFKSPDDWPDDIAPRVAGVETEERWIVDGQYLNDYQRSVIRAKLEELGIVVGPLFELERVRTTKLKLWNPNEALTTIARYLKMLVEGKPGDEGGILIDATPIGDMTREQLLEKARRLSARAA